MACRLLCCLCLLALVASGAKAGEEALRTDVCVVGGGSAGIGAAVAAARADAEVVLVERQPRLGGTSTQAYVCNWEPGPGGPLAREIADRLRKRSHAVGITSDHNPSRSKGPFGLWLINPDATYEQSLRRSGRPRRDWRAVVFQPHALGGMARQEHGDIIAIADHALDIHGAGHRRVHGQPKSPYGVPYRCLIPKGWRNLLVAGRCASFSHVAASSCRLSRTMMALGHAAGRAAAQAARHDLPVAKVDVSAFRVRPPSHTETR